MSCSLQVWLGTSLWQFCLREPISQWIFPYSQSQCRWSWPNMEIYFAMIFWGIFLFFSIYPKSMCYVLLLHPLLHHDLKILLPVVVKTNLRISKILNQFLNAPKGLRCWRTHLHFQEANPASSCQVGVLPSHGAMKIQNLPGIKPSDKRIWEFNTIFLTWRDLSLQISVCFADDQERNDPSANNTGETLHGWKVPLSTQAWWQWLSEKTTLVPQEFVLQESQTSSGGNWILAGWKNKMKFLSTPAAGHTVFKFWYWEGQCVSKLWVARILLIPKTNMLSEVCAAAMNIW